MIQFQVLRPASLQEVLKMLEVYQDRARVLAGGTDLLVQIRQEHKSYEKLEHVIDISTLEELRGIRERDNEIVMGALVTHGEAADSPIIKEEAALLAQSCSMVGSPQIRNRGTIGGGICNASPASDIIPVLIALEASVMVESVRGSRMEKIKDLFAGPYSTKLQPMEMVTKICFPVLSGEMKSVYYKVGRRKALAIARLDIAVIARQDEHGKVTDIRIAPGALFETCDRAAAAERVLLHQIPTPELVKEAAATISAEVAIRTGADWAPEYKKPVIDTVAKRALEQVLEVKNIG